MMEFLKQIFDAIAGFFKQIFGWLTGNSEQNAPASAPTTQGAGAEPQQAEAATVAHEASVKHGVEGTVAKKDVRKNLEMKNEIGAALTQSYQHTGEKAAISDGLAAKSDRLFKEMWVAEDADKKMFTEVSYVGSKYNPKEQYVTPENSQKALPMYLAYHPVHKEASQAQEALYAHWREIDKIYSGKGMNDVGLSKLAVDPVNHVSKDKVFMQDTHGLRINMPANSRLDIKPVDAAHVSVTVRPISDNPKDTYNFAPVTLPSVSKEVFEENYALVQPSKRGRTEIYVKAGTFDDMPVIGVLEGGKEVAGKGVYLAMAVKGKDGKTTAEIKEPVATLSTYKPKPRTHKTDFRGASMPVNVDHTDPHDDAGSLFSQAVRSGGDYYNRSTVNVRYGGGFYGGGWFGNVTEVSRPSGTPNSGMFGRPGRSGPRH